MSCPLPYPTHPSAYATLSLICPQEMIDVGEISVEGKTVLELGAGAGLPGLICGLASDTDAREVQTANY